MACVDARCPWCGREYTLVGACDPAQSPWFTCWGCGRTMPVRRCVTDGYSDTAIFDLPILSGPRTALGGGHYDYWE